MICTLLPKSKEWFEVLKNLQALASITTNYCGVHCKSSSVVIHRVQDGQTHKIVYQSFPVTSHTVSVDL